MDDVRFVSNPTIDDLYFDYVHAPTADVRVLIELRAVAIYGVDAWDDLRRSFQ